MWEGIFGAEKLLSIQLREQQGTAAGKAAWGAGLLLSFQRWAPSLISGTFRCTFCETEVEEDESAMPKKDARTLVARFNEQIEPIYALLRETEDVNLAYEILEPEPTEIPALKQRWERAWSFLTALLPCRVFLCSAGLSQTLCWTYLYSTNCANSWQIAPGMCGLQGDRGL